MTEPNIKKEIGRRIAEARKAKGFTLKELGEQAGGLKPTRIANWEQGVRLPGPEEIKQLAEALDVSGAFLMCLGNETHEQMVLKKENILETYYRGINQQIHGEVDFINSIFEHRGVKGEGNELILRDLLKKFIPKRFGIGTGIVIDRKGNQSKQIDIVIYDQMLYPSILALTSVHLFPVDIVYAVIEIKTTLNSTRVKESLENIASVRNLEIIPGTFTIGSSSTEGFGIKTYPSTPPMGAVFAYNSDVAGSDCFKKWFETNDSNFRSYPSIVGCLDQGVIFNDVFSGQSTRFRAIALHFGDGRTAIVSNQKITTKEHNGTIYPIKTINGQRTLIDSSRALLIFIVKLNELLQAKHINPAIKFSEHYFDEFTTFGVDI